MDYIGPPYPGIGVRGSLGTPFKGKIGTWNFRDGDLEFSDFRGFVPFPDRFGGPEWFHDVPKPLGIIFG